MSGYSREAVAVEVERQRASGKTLAEARFIALCAARVAYFKRFPRGALHPSLALPRTRLLAEHYTREGKPLYEKPDSRHRATEARRDVDGMRASKDHPAHA